MLINISSDVSAHAGMLTEDFNMRWGLLISLLAPFPIQGKPISLI